MTHPNPLKAARERVKVAKRAFTPAVAAAVHDGQDAQQQPRAALEELDRARAELAVPADPSPDPAAEAELRRLVNLVADAHGFNPEDRAQALEHALRDPDRNRALECYRDLGRTPPNSEPTKPGLPQDDALSDPAAEARRGRVLALLEAQPQAQWAVLTDVDSDPQAVLLTMVIRGQATFELRVPRAKYDPFLLLDLIGKHGGTVH